MGFFRHLLDVTRFVGLPREQRRLVFYSEGKNYWPHLEGLIKESLASSDVPVCYISSGADDPGLILEHPRYESFKTDEGFIRSWMFENIDTDVLVMTMPDLNQYQIKRSRHNVHYVYVQHSLISLHMGYREGAFDHYDTIFCAGPHHVKEIRAMEARHNLPPKNLVEHGYGRLDAIIEEAKRRQKQKEPDNAVKHVLFAPSWGQHGTIESGVGQEIVDQLVEQGLKVTLRPHPQTVKFAGDKVASIVNKHRNNPFFAFEDNVAGQDSLHDSDLMISDWSGAALDYAFGLGKPVLFVDVPRKVNNSNYEEIGIEPFESLVRDKIGKVVHDGNLIDSVTTLDISTDTRISAVFGIGKSKSIGASAIRCLLGSKGEQ